MNELFTISLIVVGFIFLIKGADLLVEGASSIALKLNFSELAIGFTIVAIGTSTPELVVSIISGIQGHNDVVFGNIIGSNNFNLFLILGISGIIFPMKLQRNTVWKEIPFSFGVTLVLLILVNLHLVFKQQFTGLERIGGSILLILFAIFMLYIYRNLKKEKPPEPENIKLLNNVKTILFIVIGIAGLTFGGKLVVDNAIVISKSFGLSERLIGLTVISIGTSLPELATSVVAAMKKKSDIAAGNVLGSNIINISLILGLSSLIHPIAFNTSLNADLGYLLFGTFLLFIFMFTLTIKKLDRWEAIIFVVCFIAYMTFLVIRN